VDYQEYFNHHCPDRLLENLTPIFGLGTGLPHTARSPLSGLLYRFCMLASPRWITVQQILSAVCSV
jgi:hypothetical protein